MIQKLQFATQSITRRTQRGYASLAELKTEHISPMRSVFGKSFTSRHYFSEVIDQIIVICEISTLPEVLVLRANHYMGVNLLLPATGHAHHSALLITEVVFEISSDLIHIRSDSEDFP